MFGGHEPGDVFPDHIEFQVDGGSRGNGLDIRMLESKRDDGDVKTVFFDIKDGKAGAVEGDGAFFDHEVAEFPVEFEAEEPAAVVFFHVGAGGGSVDVTLDDMAVEAAVEGHAAFEVDEGTGDPGIEVGFPEGFIDSGHAVGIFPDFLHGQADAVMGDALIDLKFGGEGRLDPEGFVGSVALRSLDFSKCFNDTGEHGSKFVKNGESLGFCRKYRSFAFRKFK
jgi:hypothetical protein